jgi:type II secretory pathway component PulF
LCEGETRGGGKGLAKLFRRSLPRKKIQWQWKYAFFEQLSMLLTAGLSVEQSLSTLEIGTNDGKNKPGQRIIGSLRAKIAAGMSLSEAMSCCDHAFSGMETKTVRAAEKIGHPDVALRKLAEFGEKLSIVKKKIKAATTYPAMVLVVACIALVLLMTIVVPRFKGIFDSQNSDGGKLPWLTQKVMGACDFFGHHSMAIGVFFVATFLALKICFSQKRFRGKIFSFCGKLPILGEIFLSVDLGNFFRTLGMLMSFGVPIQDALDLSVGVVTNGMVKKSLGKILERMAQGEPLSRSFRTSKFLEPTDHGLILAGEQSGNLAQAFAKIAETYDRKTEARLTLLGTLIEPVIIVLLAIFVGTITVAMFLPMISLMQNIQI